MSRRTSSCTRRPGSGSASGSWSLHGAQAILWLRAINASGDTSAYWDYHITQEHQRNHTSRYQPGFDLAA
jgi:hypothetical protein